ncbi:metallophosphoesterase [Bacteroidales bacterium OttesenSCG-928-C03]|nr:metallophosphoesterase [Bacteroidales bacterium OttesenSCG-928-C03]MDL2326844.1 metallophosphoesterase [Bacteroidales bacterium OttesenSCG-928-A14]
MFFLLVVIFWGGLNSYVGVRCWQALSISPSWKIPYIIFVVLLAISMPVSMMIREKLSPDLSGVLQTISGTWMILLVYAALFFLFFDLLRLLNHWFHIFPNFVTGNYLIAKRIAFAVSAVILVVVLWLGNRKFNNPAMEELLITTSKSLGDKGELNIVFFSDLHLNSLTKEKQLQKYVDMINQQPYDMVLIGGDFTDGDHTVWTKRGFDKILRQLHPQYGTYVSYGNHEYYVGVEESADFIRQAGFVPLRDETQYIAPDNSVVIVGRDDRTNSRRQSAENLLKNIDKDKYIVVLDHQPADLHAVSQAGADLLLCGHTHDGQIFPLTALIHLMWEVAYGHERIDNTDVYVSSGLALWGPKYRIGSQSEMVRIRVVSEK